jgi:hypothetical protein
MVDIRKKRRMPAFLLILGVPVFLIIVPWLVFSALVVERIPSRRGRSANNLKHAILALHNYQDEGNRSFPPGATFDANGQALHGWQTLLLPFIEREDIFKTIDLQKPWNDPANKDSFRSVVRTYQYPDAREFNEEGMALSYYASNARVMGGDKPLTIKQIKENWGASNTVMIGEAGGNFQPWGNPTNWRSLGAGLNRTPDGFGSPGGKSQMVQFAMADGSVRTFSSDADPEFLELLGLSKQKK